MTSHKRRERVENYYCLSSSLLLKGIIVGISHRNFQNVKSFSIARTNNEKLHLEVYKISKEV